MYVWAHIFFGSISGWLVVILTIERCFAVLMPLTVKRIVSKGRFNVFLVVFVSFFLGRDGFFGYLAESEVLHKYDGVKICTVPAPFASVVFMAIVIGDLLIPCIIIFIGNITISCLIVKRRRNHHVQYGYTNNQGDLESKLVATMVAVSITFVILSSPITIYYAIGPYLYGDDFAHNFDNPFYLIGDCIQYTNSGINFYLYVCFTNSFREELVKITNEMKCRRRTEESVRETSPVARQSSVLQTVSVARN